jgi:hypothetical protein
MTSARYAEAPQSESDALSSGGFRDDAGLPVVFDDDSFPEPENQWFWGLSRFTRMKFCSVNWYASATSELSGSIGP